MVGQTIGHYRVTEKLGAGGMGDVYRAHDSRLNRDVAIKVLPPSFSAVPDRLRRFEQEARAAGALNHPNILTLYDVGTHEGRPFLVSELLEGQTLRERVAESPLPLRKALEFAIQIASGLAAAHEKGIVHRDLKPENLFVTPDGRVKILDFGLAKLTQPAAIEEAGTNAPTVAADAAPATEAGVVLGTVGYMSPEQVRGRVADARSDIFSFGAVLYEMVGGRRAFPGDSSVEVMNAILKEDPPEFPSTPRTVPPALDRLIRRCLEKSPEERFQSARDLAFALEAVSGGSHTSAVQPALALPQRAWKKWLAAAAMAVLLAAASGTSYVAGLRKGRGASASFQLLTYRPQAIFRAMFSPDGKTIIYTAAPTGNRSEIFLISADYPEPRPLGLQDAHLLSVSSKGELLLLIHARLIGHRLFNGTLARMPLGGGAPREIMEGVREADWAPDGENIAIIREVSGKDRLEFPPGKVLCETPGYFSDLRFSPTGDRIAFFEHPVRFDDRGGVAVVDMSGRKTTLSSGYWGEEGLAWSADGKEIIFSAGSSYNTFLLYAVSLSGQRRAALQGAGGLTIQDISRDGRWLVTRDDIRADILGKSSSGAERNLSFLDQSNAVNISADGRTLLMSEESGVMGVNYAVVIRGMDGSPPVRLGEGAAQQLSPDGKWALAVVPSQPGQVVLYPTGPGEPRRLERGNIEYYAGAAWFSDGKRVAVCGNEPGHGARCYVQEISGGLPRPITPEGISVGASPGIGALVSPDGKFLLSRGLDGQSVLFPVEGGEPRPVASLKADDSVIRWTPDGREVLVYKATEVPTRVERVDITTGRRAVLMPLQPPDLAGVVAYRQVTVGNDLRSYAYAYVQYRSNLFLITHSD